MHSKGVLHRDLKPGNIMLNRSTKQLRICDFGCARTTYECNQLIKKKSNDENLDLDEEELELPVMNKALSNVGTDWYKAPEIKGLDYSESVDLWAVGCMLTEMLYPNIYMSR